jgi:GntR family transcriptional regulator, arabinose operon transcriptional repressor
MTKHQVLKKTLISKIQTHEYPLNSLFPSQNVLMRHHKLSYATVSRVLRELQTEGIIERIRGKGSFVKRNDVVYDNSRNAIDFTIKVIVSQNFGMNEDHNAIDTYQSLLLRASELGLKVQNVPFGDDCEVSESFFGPNDFFFMFNSTGYEKKVIPELQRRNIPFVAHGACEHVESGYNIIAVDVRKPTYKVCNELIASGRKKIVFVHADNSFCWFMPKVRGYQNAMKEAGLESKCWSLPFEEKDITAALDKHFADGVPQAIFAGTDIQAWEIMDYLRKRNYRIPEDIAVVGFSNLTHSRDEEISLTSIDYPHEKIGRSAVDWMVHLKKFPEITPASKIVKTKVFYRNSFPKHQTTKENLK